MGASLTPKEKFKVSQVEDSFDGWYWLRDI